MRDQITKRDLYFADCHCTLNQWNRSLLTEWARTGHNSILLAERRKLLRTAAGQNCSWRDCSSEAEFELLPQLHYSFFIQCFLFCLSCGNILAGYFPDTSRGSKRELLYSKTSLPSPLFKSQTRTFSWYILASRTFGRRSNKTLYREGEFWWIALF